jgi:hypothetical protein
MSEIKLFHVRSRANLHGYKDVPIDWFVTKRGPHYGPEQFTEDEAKALTDWLAAHRKCSTTIEPVEFPRPDNVMSFNEIPVGGENDFLMISESPDYDLPFKVDGHYDVRVCHRADAEVPI